MKGTENPSPQGESIFSLMSRKAQECGAINLSQGFPDFPPDPLLLDLAAKAMRCGANQYAPMSGHVGLRKGLADKHQKLQGCSLDPQSEITITAGATQALYTAITSVVKPGDEVLYFEPAYDCYRPAIEWAGATPVAVVQKAPDFLIDWDEVGQRITDRTRMILLNTPGNPSGYLWTDSDWQQLEDRVAGRPIIVLSDEVYEHIVFDGHIHHSILSRPALSQQCLAVFSFGKNFHVTGWKVGYIAGSGSLMKQFRSQHQFQVFSVHHPAQWALHQYLEDASHYMGLSAFYQKKYRLFSDSVQGSKFRLLPVRGSYFVLADCSGMGELNDQQLALWLTEEHGLAAIPLSPFYTEPPAGQKLLRFCFAKKEEVLLQAAEIMQAV